MSPGLLKWLDKYPYGCIEQTTSRAMPLLLFNDRRRSGRPAARQCACAPRIQDAVDQVLDMQNYAGNFGMWGPGSDADRFRQRLCPGFPLPGQGARVMSCPTTR